jgi:WD40 repeat protein
VPSVTKVLLEPCHEGQLGEYITAMAWSPQGQTLAMASGAGEVCVVGVETRLIASLQDGIGQSVDCLAFSSDGQFLAAGGQSGQLQIWRMTESPTLVATLDNPRTWIDRLAWSPVRNELAFSLGRHVQIWDAETSEVVATLPFESSSVLGLSWHPQGEYLAVGGQQGVKLWQRWAWEDDPQLRETAGASMALAFSPDGEYLASGNLDRTLLVWAFENPFPWQMRGFPGKVKQIAWSDISVGQAPLLASASMDAVVTWTKQSDATDGWAAKVLDLHRGRVNAIAFQPRSTLLASAAEDGWICLWEKGQKAVQILNGAPDGFSCLAWHPSGQLLAGGGQAGEWLIWGKSSRGRGFQEDAERGRHGDAGRGVRG